MIHIAKKIRPWIRRGNYGSAVEITKEQAIIVEYIYMYCRPQIYVLMKRQIVEYQDANSPPSTGLVMLKGLDPNPTFKKCLK